MKRNLTRSLLLSLVLTAALGLLAVATYTASGNELISLGFLEGSFLERLLTESDHVFQTQEDDALNQAQTELEKQNENYDFALGMLEGTLERSDTLTDRRYKKDDRITVGTGTGTLLLAGEAVLSIDSGTVVDVTAGAPVESGTPLLPQHYYLAAEQTIAAVTILSDTAVVSLEGSYALTESDALDYNMLADALKAMGMFKGSDTGYGSGYDLEAAPTRIQGLIMFLRLLGEEDEALACTAPCPFEDVLPWAQPYVAYAYEKGYTNGLSATVFGPARVLRPTEYVTFLLRALGYSDSGDAPDFSWDSASDFALSQGVLTSPEHQMLREDEFLRAQVAYLSYFALDAKLNGSNTTLVSSLIRSGALDQATVTAVREGVTTGRLR